MRKVCFYDINFIYLQLVVYDERVAKRCLQKYIIKISVNITTLLPISVFKCVLIIYNIFLFHKYNM